LRAKRAEERKKLAAAQPGAEHPKTPADSQPDLVDILTQNLARIHRRG
jgi:hypothetical protein